MKEWNKCNWADPDYVSTYVDIIVIAAPPAPTVPDKTICSGGNRTLTVTSSAVGTLTWYSNVALTTSVGTGSTYTPPNPAVGSYDYWVTDQSLSGLMCMSPATKVTLTILPLIANNSVAAPQTICYNTAPAGLTGTPPSGGNTSYAYLWESSTTSAVAGFGAASGTNTNQNYSPPALTQTTWFRRTVTSGPCSDISSAIQVTVYGNLSPGSIGTAQSICYNTAPSTLTQTAPATGGTGTYSYQWQSSPDNSSWGNIGGATSTTYSPPSLTSNTYYRRRVISGACGTVYSASVLITVYPDVTPGTIGNAQTICYNTVPAGLTQLTAPGGGNGSYTYRWESSPDNSTWTSTGVTTQNYSPPALTSTTYYRRRVISAGCTAEYTNSVLITVRAVLTSGTIGTSQSICYSTAPAALTQLTAPTGGTGAYTYQWQDSPDNITFTNIGGATAIGFAPPVLTATRYYRRNVTSGTCGTVSSASVTITVYGNLTPGTIGTAQSICYNTAPSTLTQLTAPAGGPGGYTWQWQDSPDNITFTNIGGATASTYSPPALTTNTYYRRRVTSGSCGTVNSTSVLITVYANLTPGTVGSAQTICYNTAPAGLTQLSAPAGGTGAYTYQWQSSSDNVTFGNIGGATGSAYNPPALTASTYYRRNVTSGSCGMVSSASFLITVYDQLTPGTVGTDQSICSGATPAALTQLTVPTGGTGAYTYQWQDSPDNITFNNIGGATAVGYAPGALGADRYYRRRVTSGTCGTVTTNTIHIIVGSLPTNATFTGNGPLCFGATGNLTSVITGGAPPYTLTITGYGVKAGYTSGSNIDLGVQPPATYNYTLTSVVDACGNSVGAGLPKNYSLIVYNDLTAGSVGNAQTICYNTVPAGFTQLSAPTGGPGAYTYQWQNSPDNITWGNIGGATLSTYTSGALTTSTYFRRQVTSGSCGTVNSASFLITVYPVLTPGSVGSAQTICYNTVPAAFTQLSAPTGGSGAYTYQWQSSADNSTWGDIGGATLSTFTSVALTSSTYFRRQVMSGGCTTVSSASFLVTVYADLLPGSVGSAQTICYNTVPAGFTQLSAPTGGTGAYTYQWQSSLDNSTWGNIGGATSPTYTSVALTGSTYFRRLVTSGSCGTVNSASFLVTVYPNLTAGSVGSAQTICYNTTPAGFTELIAPTGGTGVYTWQWQSSPDNSTWGNIGGATSSTYTSGALTASTYFRRLVTSGSCGTVNSTSFLITVHPNLTPGSVGSAQSICYNTAPAAFTQLSAPAGGTGAYTYQWQSSPDNSTWGNIGGATSSTYTSGALTASTYFRRLVTSGSCGTVNSASFLITVYADFTPGSVGSAQTICYNTAPAGFTQLTAPAGGTGAYTYQWQSSPDNSTWGNIGGATASTYTSGAMTASTYFRRLITSGSCGTLNSNSFLVTVLPVLSGGTIAGDQTICSGGDVAAFTSTFDASGGSGAFVYTWQYTTVAGAVAGDGNWIDIAASNSTVYDNGTLTTDTWFIRKAVDATCTIPVYSNIIMITVRPALAGGSIGNNQTICSGSDVAAFVNLVSPTGGAGVFTYTWQYTTVMAAVPGDGNWTDIAASNTIAYDYGTLTTQTKFVRQSEDISCSSPVWSNMVTVSVNPLPVTSAILGENPICETATNKVYQVTNTPGSTYNWTVPASLNRTSPQGLYFIIVNAVPGMAAPGDKITVTETFTNTTGCVGLPVEFPIIVSPSKIGELVDGPNPVCEGSILNHYSVTDDPTSTFSWSLPPGAFITSDPTKSGVDVTFPIGLSGDVSVVEKNGACTIFHLPLNVTVNPRPALSSSLTPPTICSGTSFNYTATSATAGATFAWSRSGILGITEASSSGTGNVSEVLTNTTNAPIAVTYVYITTAATCSGNPQNVVVTVNPSGQVNVPSDMVFCNGSTASSIIFGTNNTGGSTTYAWTNSDPTIGLAVSGSGNIASFTATNSGTAPVTATIAVTPTFANGSVSCPGTAETFTITVNPTAQVNDPADQVVCNNTLTSLVTFGTVNTVGTTTYTWTNSAPGIGLAASGSGPAIAAFTATNGSTAPVVATITVTPHFFNDAVTCDGPVQTFTITVNPTGQVNDPADQLVCNGSPTTSVIFTSDNTGGVTTYTWDNSDPSINLVVSGSGNIGSFNAVNLTTAPVVATITVTPHFANGGTTCDGAAETFTITVNPTAQVNDPADQVLCNGSNTAAVNFTTANTIGTTTYSWTNTVTGIGLAASGTGNIAPFTAVNTGTAPVVATITVTPHFANGGKTCDGPVKTFTITVNPAAQVNTPANQVVCNGASSAVVNFTTNNTGGAVTYSWDNDNTAINLGASGLGSVPSFVATNAGTSPIIANITVTPHFDNGGPVCDGPSKTFTITVNPTAQVNDPVDQVVCNGSSTATVTFATGNTGGTTNYTWTNDDTSIGLGANGSGNIPFFTATNITTAPVTAIVTVTPHFTNGGATCDGPTQTFSITVNPTAEVEPITSQVVCNGDPTALVTFSTVNTVGTTTYTWTNSAPGIGLLSPGSGDIASFTATNAGTSPVVATIVVTPHFLNGTVTCDGPAKTFTITVNPTAQVNDPADQVVCNGSPVTAVNFSTGNTGGVTTYTWDNSDPSINLVVSGSGNIGSFNAVNLTTAPVVATITVTPHFANGGTTCDGAAETFTITVNPTAQVNDPADQVLCNGSNTAAVNFTTANTIGTTTYSWTNTVTGIGLAASGTGNIAPFTAVNTGTAPVVATITVTPHFANGGKTCDGPVKTFTITVNPDCPGQHACQPGCM